MKNKKTENGKLKTENSFRLDSKNLLRNFSLRLCVSAVCLLSIASTSFAQTETPPAPSAPPTVKIPAVPEKTLPNGLKIVVVERKNVPLVTASLLIRSGANSEDEAQAGVADMTASLLLKGTKTRTATQIAEQMEFLGGNINSGANWSATNVTVNITSDKLDRALAIMSDVVLHPTFAAKEIALYKTQTLDELNVQLKQPSALANFAASRYTYGEHTAVGTPETIAKITGKNISDFYAYAFEPRDSILIFTGDISQQAALALAQKYFGGWSVRRGRSQTVSPPPRIPGKVVVVGTDDNALGTSENAARATSNEPKNIDRILVVDLPNSGQAAVTYAKRLENGRVFYGDKDKILVDENYYPALVTNSVLGGGYTNRLNLEIRIKRGLSYGARSNFAWRSSSSNFSAGAQTKNVSAAEVAELLADEIERIGNEKVGADELKPRTATLTGNFSRALETTNGLAAQISELYLYGIDPKELNSYMQNLQAVSDAQVKDFAAKNIKGGDIIIVGDYAKFKDDLQKRFPSQKVEVIAASQLNLNSDTLRKEK